MIRWKLWRTWKTLSDIPRPKILLSFEVHQMCQTIKALQPINQPHCSHRQPGLEDFDTMSLCWLGFYALRQEHDPRRNKPGRVCFSRFCNAAHPQRPIPSPVGRRILMCKSRLPIAHAMVCKQRPTDKNAFRIREASSSPCRLRKQYRVPDHVIMYVHCADRILKEQSDADYGCAL